MVPFLLDDLLGGGADHYRHAATSGQLALRFPGDACVGETTASTHARQSLITSLPSLSKWCFERCFERCFASWHRQVLDAKRVSNPE